MGALHEAGGLLEHSTESGRNAVAPIEVFVAAPAACRTRCDCGVERNQCMPDLPQTDLTPTLAALLGVPMPFGNLGKLSAELWQLTATRDSASSGSSSGPAGKEWQSGLAGAVLANARQVQRYLLTYAATSGASFSRAATAHLEALYAVAVAPTADVASQIARCACVQAGAGGSYCVSLHTGMHNCPPSLHR